MAKEVIQTAWIIQAMVSKDNTQFTVHLGQLRQWLFRSVSNCFSEAAEKHAYTKAVWETFKQTAMDAILAVDKTTPIAYVEFQRLYLAASELNGALSFLFANPKHQWKYEENCFRLSEIGERIVPRLESGVQCEPFNVWQQSMHSMTKQLEDFENLPQFALFKYYGQFLPHSSADLEAIKQKVYDQNSTIYNTSEGALDAAALDRELPALLARLGEQVIEEAKDVFLHDIPNKIVKINAWKPLLGNYPALQEELHDVGHRMNQFVLINQGVEEAIQIAVADTAVELHKRWCYLEEKILATVLNVQHNA